MGWGGRRPGAGAKPKALRERALLAVPSRSPHVQAATEQNAPRNLAEPVDAPAPATLTEDERAVWVRQAPFAVRARTLTPSTALSFERYVRMVVLEDRLSRDVDAAGGTNHRGILQRINALELQFCLTPAGKALLDAPAAEAKPVSPLDRFLNRKVGA
jgi:hypothetical protein